MLNEINYFSPFLYANIQVEERFKMTQEDLGKLGEKIDEISGDFENVKSPEL